MTIAFCLAYTLNMADLPEKKIVKISKEQYQRFSIQQENENEIEIMLYDLKPQPKEEEKKPVK